jgi:DNA repair exonuclease SbcCD ATPase subunit
MIVFKAIRWKNFLATGNYFTEIKLDDSRTNILLGESGSGKSTLLDALSFGLFNKPFRAINKSNLINSINGKNCIVEVELAVGEKEYLIRRGIKPGIFEIYCDGIIINQDSASRDYQIFLENQILKFNYKSFCQIVVLGASNFVPFMQLKPVDRRAIIEELLDIEIFSAMNVLLKQKIANNKSEMQDNAYQLSLLNEKIAVHEKYIQEMNEDSAKKIQESENKLKENLEYISGLEAKRASLLPDITERTVLLEAEIDLNKKMNELSTLESKLEDVDRRTKKEIEFYQNNDSCPTCKQTIDSTFKQNEIQAKQDKVKEIQDAFKKLDEKMLKLKDEKVKTDATKQEIANLKNEVNRCNNTIEAVKDFIKKIEKELDDQKKHHNIEHDRETILNQLREDVKKQEERKERLIIEKSVQEMAYNLLKDEIGRAHV